MPKNVVITGSTRGIGYGLALELLERGHCVVINGTTEVSINKVKTNLKKYKNQIICVAGSITGRHTIEILFKKAVDTFGSVDIWINNAGIAQSNKKFWELDNEEIDQLLEINVKGLVKANHFVANAMLEQGHGKIFNMEGFGSDGRTMDKMTVYGTSKKAVAYFTKSLAKEMRNNNVQIGVISPGMVITDLLINSMKTAPIEEQDRMKKIFNILGEPVEKVVPFLVDGMLESKKNYDCIRYLNNAKVMGKFLKSMVKKNHYFD